MTVLYDDDAWIDAAMRAQRATLCGHKPSDVIVALARAIASGTDADCFCILEAHDPATIYNRRGNLKSLLARAAHHAMTVHGFDYATHASGMIARVAAIARELPRQKPVHVREEIWAYVDNPKIIVTISRARSLRRGEAWSRRVLRSNGADKNFDATMMAHRYASARGSAETIAQVSATTRRARRSSGSKKKR